VGLAVLDCRKTLRSAGKQHNRRGEGRGQTPDGGRIGRDRKTPCGENASANEIQQWQEAEMIEVVKLNKKEQALFDGICWDLDELSRKDDAVDHLERLGQLAESLLRRKAIPQHRVDYFFEPGMALGLYGKSPRQVFENNGTRGADILRHPHFMHHLRYFIFGPDLPKDTIAGFCLIIEEDVGTSGMVLDQICRYVRKEVREKNLPSDAATEFCKLAYEIDRPLLASSVRSAAMQVKRR